MILYHKATFFHWADVYCTYMLPEHNEQQQLRQLVLENQRLLTENNQLLKMMNRRSIIGIWLRVVWAAFLIGLPFVLYFYVLEPYFDTLGSSFDTFRSGLQEVPGWKQFYEAVRGGK
jgi:hypothetical protein